jgi:type II secretory pathway predicted ATPase ExeA
MYYDYFGLKQPPFKITPDTTMFFPGGNRGAILDALIYTIMNGEGIIKVVGEVGSGKTMLCRMLERELPANVEVVYIANPSLSPENILHAIAFDLDLAVQADTSRLEVMNRLQEYLLARHGAGRHVVVFIEEAQSMPIATLEEIRLLSNLETQQNKLLQIVLFGQPELDDLISKREIRQLKERITYSFQLNPFSRGDIRDYLNTRLRACGYRSGEMFQDQAIKLIDRYSAGLVRRVNILADKAMLAAYAKNAGVVTAAHVRQAARDSEFSWFRSFRFGRHALFPAALLCVGIAVAWALSSRPEGEQMPVDSGTVPAAAHTAPPGRDAAGGDSRQIAPVPEPEVTAAVTVRTVEPGFRQTATDNQVESNDAFMSSGEDKIPVPDPAAGLTVTDTGGISSGAGMADAPAVPPVAGTAGYMEDRSAQAGATESTADIENQLLGLEGIFTPTEMGDNRYTDEELQILRAQLEQYPPEVAYDIKQLADVDACDLCWSIIYRPLIREGKL